MNLDRIIAVRTNKTVYRDGEYCVKLFDEDFSKVDVLNEALNQARVEETGLNVPKIIEVTKIDGKWAIVAINYSEDMKPVAFGMEDGAAKKWQMYRTSDTSAESLAPVGTTDGTTTLAPRSITTFVEQ